VDERPATTEAECRPLLVWVAARPGDERLATTGVERRSERLAPTEAERRSNPPLATT